jgi:hypothetical protein
MGAVPKTSRSSGRQTGNAGEFARAQLAPAE